MLEMLNEFITEGIDINVVIVGGGMALWGNVDGNEKHCVGNPQYHLQKQHHGK